MQPEASKDQNQFLVSLPGAVAAFPFSVSSSACTRSWQESASEHLRTATSRDQPPPGGTADNDGHNAASEGGSPLGLPGYHGAAGLRVGTMPKTTGDDRSHVGCEKNCRADVLVKCMVAW